MLDEKDIIKAIARGEKQFFPLLYERFSEKVYNTALSYVKNAEDAEEITQDVFIKLYKNAKTFQGDSLLSTWIYRIAVNTALNYLKKRKKRFNLFQSNQSKSDEVDFNHPGVVMENKESAAILFRAMEKLPDTQKTAFILSFIEDLPRQEVADIMETSLKAVESLLQRAKKNLRTELEDHYPNRRKSTE